MFKTPIALSFSTFLAQDSVDVGGGHYACSSAAAETVNNTYLPPKTRFFADKSQDVIFTTFRGFSDLQTCGVAGPNFPKMRSAEALHVIVSLYD